MQTKINTILNELEIKRFDNFPDRPTIVFFTRLFGLYRTLAGLLLELYNILATTFEHCKGHLSQVDDVTVIGIKVS